jgi:hypothetical protein
MLHPFHPVRLPLDVLDEESLTASGHEERNCTR